MSVCGVGHGAPFCLRELTPEMSQASLALEWLWQSLAFRSWGKKRQGEGSKG